MNSLCKFWRRLFCRITGHKEVELQIDICKTPYARMFHTFNVCCRCGNVE